MEPKSQEKYEVSSQESSGPQVQFYDPSKESIWTRLGVNFESFKRAPGTTGYVLIVSQKLVTYTGTYVVVKL
jgi:amino acid transporter